MVDRNEFTQWMGVLREDIRGVHERLDTLNGRTRAVETKLAVAEAMSSEKAKDPAARWGAAGAGLAGLLGALYQWMK